MKKHIRFEQISQTEAVCHFGNLFGSALSQAQNRLKKHSGNWDPPLAKYVLPIHKIPAYTNEVCHEVGRDIAVENIPRKVTDFLRGYGHQQRTRAKRKQLYVDRSCVSRYQFIKKLCTRLQLNNAKRPQKAGGTLLVCRAEKIPNWAACLADVGELTIGKGTDLKGKTCTKGLHIIASEEFTDQAIQAVQANRFAGILFDCFEYFLKPAHRCLQRIRDCIRYLQFTYFVTSVIPFDDIDVLVGLVTGLEDVDWLRNRYKRQNYQELMFVLEHCRIFQLIADSPNQLHTCGGQLNQSTSIHIVNVQLPSSSLERVKSTTRKLSGNGSLSAKMLLGDFKIYRVRSKGEKQFMNSVMQVLNKEKIGVVKNYLMHLISVCGRRVAVVIESMEFYRAIENFFCDHQIAYCHFQHCESVLDFNTNQAVRACLVKWETLEQYHQLRVEEEEEGSRGEASQQHQCLSAVAHVLFVDTDWAQNLQAKTNRETCVGECFDYLAEFTRHYFVVKGSYEEKWAADYCEKLLKDALDEDGDDQLQSQLSVEDPTASFSAIQQAAVLEEYGHCKQIKGVLDIDEEFDKFEYEAMLQKKEREDKKKRQQARRKRRLQGEQSKAETEDRVSESCPPKTPVPNSEIYIREDLTTEDSTEKNHNKPRRDHQGEQLAKPRKRVKKSDTPEILLVEDIKSRSRLRLLLPHS